MNASGILKKACYAGIGVIELVREELAELPESVKESFEKLVERGERLDQKEESLARALLVALNVKPRVPSPNEVDRLIPGYDDLTVTEIIDQIKKLSMKQLEIVRAYERHHYNRIRIIRQIDKELDEARIIPGYDNLTVGEVVEHLDDLQPQELAAIRDYEKNHRNRKTVLSAIERNLAAAV